MGYTKKQAGVIYGAIKRGNLTAPKGFIKAMYDMVGNNWNHYALRHESEFNQKVFWQTQSILDFIFDKRYDLCQYIIDGYSVETEQLDRVISSTTVTQDMLDNPESYGIDDMFFDFMYEVGDTYEVTEPYFMYVVKDEHDNEVTRVAC